MFAVITQEYFKNIFRLKIENCLHGCFPGNNVCKIFWKIFFIDYLPATAFIDNDEITQATRTGFLKQSLKPERGGGEKFQSTNSRQSDKKFAKYPEDPFEILCKDWTT